MNNKKDAPITAAITTVVFLIQRCLFIFIVFDDRQFIRSYLVLFIVEILLVGVPLRQQLKVGSYLIKQKLKGVKKYPLVLML